VLVRREENEFLDTRSFPCVDEIIEGAMERLATQGGVSRKPTLGVNVDAVFERRCAQHSELRGEIIGEMLHNYRVASKGHVRSVLLTGADGHDQARVASERLRNLGWSELLESQWLERRTRVRRGERLSHSR